MRVIISRLALDLPDDMPPLPPLPLAPIDREAAIPLYLLLLQTLTELERDDDASLSDMPQAASARHR